MNNWDRNEQCIVCKGIAIDTICNRCDDEYAEWLESKGYKVGEFDNPGHPGYVAEPHKGTKWKVLGR